MNDQKFGRVIVRYMRRPGRSKTNREAELTCSRLLVDRDVVDLDLSIWIESQHTAKSEEGRYALS